MKSESVISWLFVVFIFKSTYKYKPTELLKLAGTTGSPGPPPLLKQGHLQLVSQDHVQPAFEYYQGWTCHNLCGQPGTVFSHSHSIKMVPDAQREAPVSQFVPTISCPITMQHWKEPGFVFSAPSLCVFVEHR